MELAVMPMPGSTVDQIATSVVASAQNEKSGEGFWSESYLHRKSGPLVNE